MKKKKTTIAFLTDRLEFPPLEHASSEGLLAVGGDLSPERLRMAYENGIFPWFNEDSLILWWSPDPRMVLFPEELKISKSMRRVYESNRFRFTRNHNFKGVIDQCASVERKGQPGTWITATMKQAYLKLHELGMAISYEVWEGKELVGGLYGIDLGHVFCGESMFSLKSNASKCAFICLVKNLREKHYKLIDCQMYTPHLESLGAREIPRDNFLKILRENRD
ncbi:MAG TPA: leucyl/phenylalanyl-tRNA--protein transferase [Eudoraea sp.]|nr:leucyl/phenylalanyl-tRNA--protein transferase [Eudoraea sp.]